jgi:DNA-binding transcriptional LysR family regulator
VADLFARLGYSLRLGLNTNYLETIKMLVGVGLGWSALPNTMLDDSLVQLSVANLNLSRQLGSVQHRDLSQSRAARTMLALLSEYATMPAIDSAI